MVQINSITDMEIMLSLYSNLCYMKLIKHRTFIPVVFCKQLCSQQTKIQFPAFRFHIRTFFLVNGTFYNQPSKK